MLGTTEDEELTGPVVMGNVILYDDPDLKKRNICGVILLAHNVFTALEHLPPTLLVNDVLYKFISVVFLTNPEHLIWKEQGHDVLMDHYTSINKDLLQFGERNN